MDRFLSNVFGALRRRGADPDPGSTEKALNYEEMFLLDAEALAEGGIGEAYEELLPALRSYVAQPTELTEHSGEYAYGVSAEGKTYNIWGPDLPEDGGGSWWRATHALFDLVNRQLSSTDTKFYAINGGNDLGGMFLTPEEVDAAKKSLKSRGDWPYLPGESERGRP